MYLARYFTVLFSMNGPPDLISIARGLILPPQSLFLLLALGLLLRRRWLNLGTRTCATAVILLFLLSTPVVAHLLAEPLEHFTPPLTMTYHTDAEAIVVLAAGRLTNAPEYNGRDVPDSLTLARLRYAAKLHRETGLPVLVSGGSGGWGRESYAAGMARSLRNEFRIPVRWIEGQSSNTAENAQYSARILRQNGVQHILLVTHAIHMRRSVMAFTQAGLTVIPAPTMFFSAGGDPYQPRNFIPSVEGLRRSQYAIYEWLGNTWYWLHYETPI
jgi:uncharacterized SAM-binding protein YcdF (DUF218 family)